MQSLSLPTDEPGDVFLECISRVRNSDLKERLILVKDLIVAAAEDFGSKAKVAQSYKIEPNNFVGELVTKSEMEAVYNGRMVKKNSPGRTTYEKLLNAPKYGRCPLCAQRVVSTLDHYMPKAEFPSLAVVPANLVPACQDCNKIKSNVIAKTPKDQTFHPYFDDVEKDQWVFAKVNQSSPVTITFYVNPPNSWDDIKIERAKKHFKVFGLASLYSSQAASELQNIQYELSKIFETLGSNGAKAHLIDAAQSRKKANLNSWQTAMYEALSNSDWYCDGGFYNKQPSYDWY